MSPASRLRRVSLGVALLALLAVAQPAAATTGGYPYSDYSGPGTDPATYTWTDANGNGFSPYGYAYRNCTDYVAWKLSSANGFGDYRGLGNASSWAERARGRGYRVNRVPARGAVAWWGGELFGGFGHVAWVVVADVGSVEIAEYNHHGDGRFDLRWIRPRDADAYIHFEDLPIRLRDGDFVSAPGEGGAYRLVGGAPVYVSRWSGFGGPRRVLAISRARFERLRPFPRDGAFLAGRWRHLRRYPQDGTILRSGPAGRPYVVRGGVPRPFPALPARSTPVVVDPAAIAHAGEPGIWRFLR